MRKHLPVTSFWLTWSDRKQDYVRRATGETLAELVTETRRLGLGWHAQMEKNGMWFVLSDPNEHRRRRRR